MSENTPETPAKKPKDLSTLARERSRPDILQSRAFIIGASTFGVAVVGGIMFLVFQRTPETQVAAPIETQPEVATPELAPGEPATPLLSANAGDFSDPIIPAEAPAEEEEPAADPDNGRESEDDIDAILNARLRAQMGDPPPPPVAERRTPPVSRALGGLAQPGDDFLAQDTLTLEAERQRMEMEASARIAPSGVAFALNYGTPEPPESEGRADALAIPQGRLIPAVLKHEVSLSSQSPFIPLVVAQVTRNVYDGLGMSILVPAGSELRGRAVLMDDKRLYADFFALRLPTGEEVEIEGRMSSSDGSVGVPGRLRPRKWLRGAAQLTSALVGSAATIVEDRYRYERELEGYRQQQELANRQFAEQLRAWENSQSTDGEGNPIVVPTRPTQQYSPPPLPPADDAGEIGKAAGLRGIESLLGNYQPTEYVMTVDGGTEVSVRLQAPVRPPLPAERVSVKSTALALWGGRDRAP